MPTIISHAAVPLALGIGLGHKRIPAALLMSGVLASMLPDADVVLLLGIGSSAGLTLAGALVLLGLRRRVPGVPAGTGRAAAAGAAGALVALLAAALVPGDGLLLGTVAVLVAAVGYAAVVRVLDPGGLRELVRA